MAIAADIEDEKRSENFDDISPDKTPDTGVTPGKYQKQNMVEVLVETGISERSRNLGGAKWKIEPIKIIGQNEVTTPLTNSRRKKNKQQKDPSKTFV